MKKVLVHAYTQFNFGDDLFIKMLIERYPQTQFLLYAPKKYTQVFSQHPNILVFPNDTYRAKAFNRISRHIPMLGSQEVRIASKCDATVQIGGSLFMETDHWQREWRRSAALRKASKQYFLLGANFGPYKHKSFYSHYRHLFQDFTDICFRDQYSYELFSDMQHVRIAPDIVFGLDIPPQEEIKSIDHITRKKIVISIIKPSIRRHLADYDEVYMEKMKEIAIFFMSAGFEVTFAAFCSYEGDEEAMNDISSSIPKDYSSLFSMYTYETNNLQKMIALFQSASLIIACRFHAMIMGWILQKPVYPIVYSKKMSNAMRDLGFDGGSSDYEHLHQLRPEEVMKQMTCSSIINIQKQRETALNHFNLLDSFLKA